MSVLFMPDPLMYVATLLSWMIGAGWTAAMWWRDQPPDDGRQWTVRADLP